MVDEIFSGLGGIDNGGIKETQIKVAEEDVKRVQQQGQQAKQIFQQIQQDKKNNNKLAKFLTFLLQTIENESIINGIYTLFFVQRDMDQKKISIRKNVNIIVVVGFFVPFYKKTVLDLGLGDFFQQIFSFDCHVSLTTYISYIKKLSHIYHDNIPIDKTLFLDFIQTVVIEYGLVEKEKISKEKMPEFQKTLSKEFYGDV